MKIVLDPNQKDIEYTIGDTIRGVITVAQLKAHMRKLGHEVGDDLGIRYSNKRITDPNRNA